MRAETKKLLLWIALGAGAAGLIAVAITFFMRPAEGVVLNYGDRPIDFLAPNWFYLWAVVPFFYVVRTTSLTDVSTAQQLTQATLRSLLIIVIAGALARPAWTASDTKIATVVLVDVSKSVSSKQLDKAKAYIAKLEDAKGGDDRVYVVSFAERPKVVLRKKNSKQWKIDRHVGADHGTNIQAAMQLAYGMYPDGFVPRMVIISDGIQTRGDILVESYRAEEFGVKVSFKMFSEKKDRVQEVRLVSLNLPDEIKAKQPFEVVGEVFSTHKQKVTFVLYKTESGGVQRVSKVKELRPGTQTVKFRAEAMRKGTVKFKLVIKKPQYDTQRKNNVVEMVGPVKGRPRVLYVEGGLLRDPSSAGYLKRALTFDNIDVDVRGPRGIPHSKAKLDAYDLVIVSDVPRTLMGQGQMSALKAYTTGGGGLIVAGGQDSFGSGGYQNTTIEKIMPVRFDSEKTREQPNVAIALVMDRSGSMSGSKIQAAKESASATARVLQPRDLITVIAFDNQPRTVVRLQRASNRMRIQTDISRLTAGGGTNIYPALREAYEVLRDVTAKVKHVIVLSDGQAPYTGIADLCQEMRSARITVSAVGIGSGADRNLLNLIADNGDGRLYMTNDVSQLPRIFMKETSEAQKSQLVEDDVHVHVVKRVEAIEGTGVASAPALLGYVTTKPKPRSEVILVSDLGEPILARWKVGAGTSVAWTSDVKNRWSVRWITWGGYPKFWAQLVRSSMRHKDHKSFDIYHRIEDGRAIVEVDAIDAKDKFVNDLETKLEVVHPSGKVVHKIDMKQTAAGRYVADFRIDQYGSYLLRAYHYRGTNMIRKTQSSIALTYADEYRFTEPRQVPLRHAATVTGGLNLDNPIHKPKAVFKPAPDEKDIYIEDLWPWVLLLVAMLLILDLYFKRIRVFGHRVMRFS